MENSTAEHQHFLNKIRKFHILTLDEEYQLATDWREKQDKKAMDKIAKAHLKLVVKVAHGYRGYGLPISDLIAEGNIGMMQAMKNYDPERGFRFSTYAMWWIKASIQDYVLHSWSLVKIGTTAAQKKLFFSLKKTKTALAENNQTEYLTTEMVKKIATKLDVSEEEVWSMDQRLGGKDSSLNAPVKMHDANVEWVDWLADDRENQESEIIYKDELNKRKHALENAMNALNEREQKIIAGRRLEEPPKTLEEMSQKLSVSRERVRQLEVSAFDKLKKALKRSQLH